MEDHLEIKRADDRACLTDVVFLRDGVGAARLECPIDSLELVEQGTTVAVEGVGRGDREHCITLELGDAEFGLDAGHHRIEQRAEQLVAGRDAATEVDAVRLLDPDDEAGIPGDVCQQEILLADGRTHESMVRGLRVRATRATIGG